MITKERLEYLKENPEEMTEEEAEIIYDFKKGVVEAWEQLKEFIDNVAEALDETIDNVAKALEETIDNVAEASEETQAGPDMNPGEFKLIWEEFAAEEEAIMGWKENEYAGDEDKLLNFNQVAPLTGLRPSQVAFSYLMKHIQSIGLSIQQGNYTDKWYWEDNGREGLKQRIADARNYLILLAACIEQEKGGQE